MKQLNPERLRHNLNTVVNDVEKILHEMSETTGDQIGDLKSRAGSQLHDAGRRLGEVERHTAAQLRRAGRQAQGYAREHPWQLLGGLAAIAVALTVISRTRH
jgi:ElaB/YqjD/DUF883 family membrane-anchored ribosome-binding protein